MGRMGGLTSPAFHAGLTLRDEQLVALDTMYRHLDRDAYGISTLKASCILT
jgi:hypothetical protein